MAFEKKMAALLHLYRPRISALAVLWLALFTLNCFSSEKTLPGVTGTGQITGKVVGPDGTGISGVTITTAHNGEILTVTSSSSGAFSFALKEVQRGTGFNLQFIKSNFENAARAAVISLPNLKVDMGEVTMYISGGSAEIAVRRITGQVLDNFSYRPLAGANVTTTDSAGQVLFATTDDNGRFALSSSYFPMPTEALRQRLRDQNYTEAQIDAAMQAMSTFAVGVYKDNYITRTDITAVITAEENTIRTDPVRLYQKFGAIYGYVTEDSLATPLNGVSVSLKNSNNQTLTCTTGGPYNAVPLNQGEYCPDLTGIVSPISGTLGDNAGGIKMQNDFLLLGNRYEITLSRTSSDCANRSATATNCYRTKTTFVDVSLTGSNAMSGQKQALYWDSWIYGTVSAGSGVTIKMYNTSNTLVGETISGAGGAFVLDNPNIYRAVQYKLTFEKQGYYSRLIGLSGADGPVSVTVGVAGPNNAGAVAMTALPPPTHCLRGTVKDHWSTLPVGTATVAVYDGRLTPVPSRTGSRSPGSTIVSGVANTADLAPGMLVAGTGISNDTTIVEVISTNQFRLSTAASTLSSDMLSFSVYQGGWRTATTDNAGLFNIGGDFANPPPRAATRAAGNPLVTLSGPETTGDLAIGLLVGGTGILPNTRIINIVDATTIRLSASPNAAASDNISFAPRRPGEILKSGYTGEILVEKQQFSFVHSGVPACPGSPFDLDSNAVGACNATGPGPVGGISCESKLQLYPLGIYAVINGQTKNFRHQLKQTYERFLTEKIGLTLSARTGALQLTSALPQKNWDFDTLYLHFDDTPRALPTPPEGRWSNHVPVNPLPATCTSTVTENCSPRANGVLTEGIGADDRTAAWDLKTYVYYHFYAAAAGSYTIETTGTTDTHLTLKNQVGADLGSDDDSGSGSNARIGPINLLRGWYYVKVRGKNDNVFGFFDVRVTGPSAAESNYATMLTPSASYSTNCGTNNGNMVLSWYDATQHLLFIAAPGEGGACSATATIDKHGPVGQIVRGRFGGSLRPIAPAGANATVTPSPWPVAPAPLPAFTGFFNVVRQE